MQANEFDERVAHTPTLVVLWATEEAQEKTDDPSEGEGEEGTEDVEEAGGVWAVIGVQIGLHGVVEGEEDDEEDGATKPGEPSVQEFESGGAVFRAEPIPFVGKIDEFGRQGADDGGHSEANDGGEHRSAHEKREKDEFGLPAVGRALSVEMGLHQFRQLRVIERKMESGVEDEQDKAELGQTGVHAQVVSA